MDLNPNIALNEALKMIDNLNRDLLVEKSLKTQYEMELNECKTKNSEIEKRISELEIQIKEMENLNE